MNATNAMNSLKNLTPEEAIEVRRRLLLEDLCSAVRQMQSSERFYRSLDVIRSAGICAAVLLLWKILSHLSGSQIYMAAIAGIVATFIAARLMLVYERYKNGQQQYALIQELRDDVQSAGVLAVIAHLNLSSEPVHLAKSCLKNLLPRLQSEQAEDFTPETMDAALHLLNSEDSELVTATLKGLEKIGDRRALAPVAKLAEQTQLLHVQAAAQECLPYLQARAAQQEKAATLLRPSSVMDAPATLLRPSLSQTQEAAPEQLLRPGQI